LSDPVPVDASFTGGTEGWTCPNASVAGTSCTQKLVVGAHSTTAVTYTITVRASLPPSTTKIVNAGHSSTGTCSLCSVTSRASKADLAVSSKVDNSGAALNSNVKFTITVLNKGPDTATTVALTDVPTGLTYVSSAPTEGTLDPVTGIWTIGSLAKGSSATLVMIDTVTSTSATNTSMAASPHELDPNVANSTAKVVLGRATGVAGTQPSHGATTIAGGASKPAAGTKSGGGTKPRKGATGAGSKSHTGTRTSSASSAGGSSKTDAQEFAFWAVGVWRVIGLALVAVILGLLVSPMVVRRWRINTWR
jgi:uncharacterized repeat protein (TIGR01451 family)